MKKPRLSDNFKASLVRWWFAGAVYYLIGMGTELGMNSDSLDFIFFLGLGMGITSAFILNPIIYGFFNVKRRGKSYSKKYLERSSLQNAMLRLLEIFRCFVCVVLVVLVYQYLNLALIAIFDLQSDTAVIAGEPILFGVFYTIVYWLMDKAADLLHRGEQKKDDKQ
ncbi:MAG: hypothetical protein LUJ09_00385 [Firmicutes bacterium]|nr:hypothetical protein [Bacillota bacterium]